ncbi:MAG: hypothetical protein Q8N03_10935 [Ignavibacteria bacterium]|nr:hypothetical protein [Ignavibacteria bacterium]MDP3829844.1 hypothetical protein [Ignavibacteriaceae bacterium]
MKYESPGMNYEVEFKDDSSEIQQNVFPAVDPIAIAAVILIAAITAA